MRPEETQRPYPYIACSTVEPYGKGLSYQFCVSIMWLNDHIWENLILTKPYKTRFFSKEVAVSVIETLLSRDRKTCITRQLVWSRYGAEDRVVLVRAFVYIIGTDCYWRLMYAAKVVVIPTEDILKTAYPEFYHKRSKIQNL